MQLPEKGADMRFDRLTRLRCGASPADISSDGCSCRSRVPPWLVAVARVAAWSVERGRGSAHDGFFHFAWRGDVWLAYGLPGGRVRGVYCPAHRSEREERLGYDPELALAV